MGKQKTDTYSLRKISMDSLGALEEAQVATLPQEEEIITKVTIAANYKLLDLIRRYARVKGMSQGDAVVSALLSFRRTRTSSQTAGSSRKRATENEARQTKKVKAGMKAYY